MKKSLIAIALLGAFSAPAFADTTLYGVVDIFAGEATASGMSSAQLIGSGGLATSRLGVKNVEDIGDGWKSLAVLEYRLDATSNTSVGSNVATTGSSASGGSYTTVSQYSTNGLNSSAGPARQQLLGLTNADYGTVAAGRLQTTAYDWAGKFDPLAGSSISPLQFSNGSFNIGATAVHARANNAIAYISPSIYGTTLAVNYALASENVGLAGTGNATGNQSTQISALLLSLYTEADNLAVGVVYDKQSSAFTATNATSATHTACTNLAGNAVSPCAGIDNIPGANQLDIATGVSYNFGVAKLFGTFQTHKVQYVSNTSAAGNADKAYSLSTVVPLGGDAVVGGFSRLIKSASEPSDKSLTSYTLAYTHPFSKLTTLYTSYTHLSNGLAGTTGVSTVGSLVGLGDAKSSINPVLGGNGQLFTVGINKKF